MSNCENSIVAIVDSGIGGISILRELIKKFNGGNYIYFADNRFMPYGNKSCFWLKNRLNQIINQLTTQYHASKVIIACNTASTCLDESNKKVITMKFDSSKIYLATNLTKKNLHNIDVISDNTLAKQIELNILDDKKLDGLIKRHIKFHNLATYKEFVLGCTHYELVFDYFKKYCPNTSIIKNSSMLLDSLELDVTNQLNVVVLLSKKDKRLEDTIKTLIRR